MNFSLTKLALISFFVFMHSNISSQLLSFKKYLFVLNIQESDKVKAMNKDYIFYHNAYMSFQHSHIAQYSYMYFN